MKIIDQRNWRDPPVHKELRHDTVCTERDIN